MSIPKKYVEKIKELSNDYVDYFESEDIIKEQSIFFKKNLDHVSDCFTDTRATLKEHFSEEDINENDLQGYLETLIVAKTFIRASKK